MVEKKRQAMESVCEKSMQLMVNIIKLSSFSLATMNLREKHKTNDRIKSFTGFFSSNSETSKSKRSEAPLSKSDLMEEDAAGDRRDFSKYIERFHMKTKNDEVNTDRKAGAYIKKFHHKNSRHFTLAAPTSLPMVLPPPPPSSINKGNKIEQTT